ncbi:MAG: M1 family metallopeptidase [Phycisphaerales bacterium]|nr:M1 family metallopeptidase [Phycisphaerales bacterium]
MRSIFSLPTIPFRTAAALLAFIVAANASAQQAAPPTQAPAQAPAEAPANEESRRGVVPHRQQTEHDPRIDTDTGRMLATWRPSTGFDHKHMRLELDFPDLNAPKLKGKESLTVIPIGRPRDRIRLDGQGMVIHSVKVSGRPAKFDYNGRELVVHFSDPIPPGTATPILIDYEVDFGSNRGQGLTWSAGKADADNPTDQASAIHSQGEASDNSRWFLCHDFPNEKLTTELIVTAEDGFEVSSNGRLVSRQSAGKGRTRWHWLQDKPHANYLVTLIIGKLSIIELGGPDSARPGLSIPVYTTIGTEDTARRLYKNTPAMIAYFEKLLDEPYPWDRYAQLIVRDFIWGGMENTAATTMTRGSLYGDDGSQDGLIAHELGHQWFGDLLTCKGWENLWLNEGWASYCEALWEEEDAGSDPDARRRAYLRTVKGWLASQLGRNSSYAPDYPALGSNLVTNELENMAKPDDVYAKGALLIHMLRMRLGDDVFFAGTRLYLDRFKFQHVTTDDFRRCMEEVSGQSLERFFDQWAMRPGLARLNIAYGFDAGSQELKITVDQTQRVDALNPAYAFSLPFFVRYADGPGEYLYLDMDTTHAQESFPVRERPISIAIDPRVEVMAGHNVTKDLEPPEGLGE